MRKLKYAPLTVFVATIAILLAFSCPAPGVQHMVHGQGACPDGTAPQCVEWFDKQAMEYRQECGCCSGGTIVATYAPVTWVAVTATPRPSIEFNVCVPDGCDDGCTRLALARVNAVGTTIVLRYLRDCGDDPCPCGDTDQPCTMTGTGLVCMEWEASVRGAHPVWYANREPYPRGMVGVEMALWVSDESGNRTTSLPPAEFWGDPVDPGGDVCDCRDAGNCEEEEHRPAEGTVCDYRLGLQTRAGPEPPTWNVEACGSRTGWEIQCPGYTRSSWGLPEHGKGEDCESLPAHQATASVPYHWWLGREWYQWERRRTGSKCTKVPGWGTAACDLDGDGTNDPDTRSIPKYEYRWVHYGPNWEYIPWITYNGNVQLAPTRPCGPHPVGVLWIPVIEVQAPIEKDR